MSGCLDRLRCDCDCDCLEPVKEWVRPKRNMIASVISGTLVSCGVMHTLMSIMDIFTWQFSVGWWLVIDACADHATPIYAAFNICGIVSTIALLM